MYLITPHTLALLPHYSIDHQTKVLETNQSILCKEPPLQLIKLNCLIGGSSYDGRKEAMTYHFGFKQRIPIAIFPQQNLYFFPTKSPEAPDCIWLSLANIRFIKRHENKTNVQFHNGYILTLEQSLYTVRKQHERAGMCKLMYEMGMMRNQTELYAEKGVSTYNY
ncbi:competence protein ComK [Gracilibacillus marinus]|uniref:Competence protein ComK n=1 Tax=Gracilibacillus marinus TaxID=630535 RepID=A0ABV8VSE1_9BACI